MTALSRAPHFAQGESTEIAHKADGTHTWWDVGTVFALVTVMKKFIWVASPLLLSLGLAVGCNGGGDDDEGSGGTSSGGTGTGGNGTGGSNTGGTNTGGSNTGGTNTGGTGEGGLGGFGGGGGEGGGWAGEEVALCEAALEGIDGCDSGRQCNYEIAHSYCSVGNTAATLGMSVCFQLGQGCHTPADPGNAQVETCFETVIQAEGTELSADLRAEAESKCDAEAYQPLMLEVFAVMAGDEIAEGFADCVNEVTDCEDIETCVVDNLGVPLPSSCE